MKTIILANLPWQVQGRTGVRAGSRWPHLKCRTEGGYLPFPFYLAYAAALLQRSGFDVRLIDAIAERLSYRAFRRKVISLAPSFMVVETSTVSLRHDLSFLRTFRGRVPLVLCGPDVTMVRPDFLTTNSFISVVMRGEYEETLLELAQAWRDNQAMNDVKGIVHREGNVIRLTPERPLIKDLDELPWPLRDQLPMERYVEAPCGIPTPCASMWASRGCPFKCSFCLWPQVMYHGNSYRARSVVSVVDEMEYLVKEKGYRSIYFDDDTWNVGRQRMIAFCDELQRRKLNIPWAIMARANLMDKELLRILRQAGLFAVKYGVESSQQNILNNVKKDATLTNVEEIIRYTHLLGIRTHLTFSFGLPGETADSIRQTIHYASYLDPTSVQFSIATPFPGTAFYEEMDKAGLILTKDWEKYDGNYHSVIKTGTLAARQLVRARKEAYAYWAHHCFLRGDTALSRRHRLWYVGKRVKHLLRAVQERKYVRRCLGHDYMRFASLQYRTIPAEKLNADYLWEPAGELTNTAYRREKPNDVFRVICLGDSTTAGHSQLSKEQTYPYFLERLLAAEIAHKRVEVMNAGESGFSSFQGERYLSCKLWEYEPDVVIAWFGTQDNSRAWAYQDKEQKMITWAETDTCAAAFFEGLKSFLFMGKNLAVNKPRVSAQDYKNHCERMLRFSREKKFEIFFVVPFCVDVQHNIVQYLKPYKEALEELALQNEFQVIDVLPVLSQYLAPDLFIETSHPNGKGNSIIAKVFGEHILHKPGCGVQTEAPAAAVTEVVPQDRSGSPRLIGAVREKGMIAFVVQLLLKTAKALYRVSRDALWRLLALPRWRPEIVLTSGDLRLGLGQGRSCVWWQGNALSKDVGLTTSFYYRGCWHDSSQATWVTASARESDAEFILRWPAIPLSQRWKIALDNTTVRWSVAFEVEEQVSLLEYKAGVMFRQEYTLWRDMSGQGRFPRIRGWEEIRLVNAQSTQLCVMRHRGFGAPDLPPLVLRSVAGHDGDILPQLQNTGRAIYARLMQMRRIRGDDFPPGLHQCFDLELIVEAKAAGHGRVQKRSLPRMSAFDYRRRHDMVRAPSVEEYSTRTPLAYLKEKIAVLGYRNFTQRVVEKIRTKQWKDYYLEMLGVLDGCVAYKGPAFVQIDVTNNCNNDCIGCWCNSPLLKERRIPEQVKQQTLPLGLVIQTIDELQSMGAREIYFAGGGEPFMHPHMLDIIRHVKKKGLRCYINTNFTLVTPEIARELVALQVDHLIVSIWAGTPQTYAATHPNKSEPFFDQLKETLKFLNYLKKDVPKVNIYNVISNLNYHELEAMIQFGVETGSNSVEFTVIDTIPQATDALVLTDAQRLNVLETCTRIRQRLQEQWRDKIEVLQFEQFVRRMSFDDARDAQYDRNILAEMPCYIGWLFSRILADGNVNFCLKAHRIPVGNLYAQSFRAVWNSPTQQAYRATALAAPRDDPFFSQIGNDPAAKNGCYKSCDDLARNTIMHKKMMSMTVVERDFLRTAVRMHKLRRFFTRINILGRGRERLFTRRPDELCRVRRGKLLVTFCRDGIRLFWQGQPVTKFVGLNSSVRVYGVWHNSSQGTWRILRRGRTMLTLVNEWGTLPLVQTWQVTLQGSKIIWDVCMTTQTEIELEEKKVSLVLSPAYQEWFTDHEAALFSPISQWQDMLIRDTAVRSVGVRAVRRGAIHLPEIKMSADGAPAAVVPQVQNTDVATGARILSLCHAIHQAEERVGAGTHHFFAGMLTMRDADG